MRVQSKFTYVTLKIYTMGYGITSGQIYIAEIIHNLLNRERNCLLILIQPDEMILSS